jgi:hypothetical protein
VERHGFRCTSQLCGAQEYTARTFCGIALYSCTLIYACIVLLGIAHIDCSFLHTTIYASSIIACQVGKLKSAQDLLANEPLLGLESLELGHISRLDTDVSFLLISLLHQDDQASLPILCPRDQPSWSRWLLGGSR